MTTTVGVAEEEEGKQSKLSVELKDKIEITEKEREIFDRLLGTLRFCNLDTQLRVAGGWVRDKVRTLWNTPAAKIRFWSIKIVLRGHDWLIFCVLQLLGRDSDDIDIAIDNMYGSEFLDNLKDYLASRGEQVQGDTVIERSSNFFSSWIY